MRKYPNAAIRTTAILPRINPSVHSSSLSEQLFLLILALKVPVPFISFFRRQTGSSFSHRKYKLFLFNGSHRSVCVASCKIYFRFKSIRVSTFHGYVGVTVLSNSLFSPTFTREFVTDYSTAIRSKF